MCHPWFRHCQSCFVGFILVAVIVAAVILWKVNRSGFAGEWGVQLQEQLDEYGLHAEFSSVRLSLSRGLIAKDLAIYVDADRTTLLASADRLYLDIDRATAMRGEWQIRSAFFENAYLRLPDECAPHHLTELTGKAALCRENCLTITETTGRLGQLALSFDATLLNFDLLERERDQDSKKLGLESFLGTLHQEVGKWTADPAQPSLLSLSLQGDLRKPSTLEGLVNFEAPRIQRLDYEMADLRLAGRVTRSSLMVSSLTFEDRAGAFQAEGYYGFPSRKAVFDLTSRANLQALLRDGLGIDKLQKLTFTRAPEIRATGEFTLPENGPPKLSLTGHLEVQDFRFLKNAWPSLSSDFSWQEDKLYLRDLLLRHDEGTLSGKLLFQNENIRYHAISTLPAHLFEPFIKPGGAIQKTLDRASFDEDSEIRLSLQGSIRPSELTDWTASGRIELFNFAYNDVPANFATAGFNLTPLEAIYTQPEIEFDLTNDASFKAFGGPESAIVRAQSIRYDSTEKLTRIDHLHGVCWLAPVLRLFIPKSADYIERTYRASEPPAFSSSGVIDHLPSRERTSFHTRINANAPMYYDFLGKPVELRETSALIHTHHRQIDISELSSYAFSGPVNGKLSVLLSNRWGRKPDFRGELRWTRLRLADIGTTYGFDQIEKGLVTGRLDFMGTAGKIQTLDGVGNIGLEQGHLFKAPVFGPLSPLIAGIQGHDRTSHETARDASCNFLIRAGTLYTDDFITSTDSLTVKAEGSIDLARKTLDMTARADTEGLLKLVTLPLNLSGFNGLFQFRGTGPVADPTWKNTPFTRPKESKKAPLFAPPPRGQVVPE